jgi:hypothetical protein
MINFSRYNPQLKVFGDCKEQRERALDPKGLRINSCDMEMIPTSRECLKFKYFI